MKVIKNIGSKRNKRNH